MRDHRSLGRPFFALLVGQVASRLGDGIYDVGLLWLVLTTTGSGLAVGIMLVCETVPALIFTLPGGALGDRFNRRQLVLYGDLARVLFPLILGVAFARGYFNLYAIYVCTFFLAGITRIQSPVMQALFPSMIGPDQYRKANAVFRIFEQIARIAGPVLGGILVAVQPVWLFYGNALSFLVAALATLAIPRALGEVHRVALASTTQDGLVQSVRTGLRYIREHRSLWVLIGLGAMITIAFGPLNVAVPELIRSLGLPSSSYGWAAGMMGLGMFFGAASGALLPSSLVRLALVKWSFLGVSICFLLVGVFPSFRMLLGISLGAGYGMMLSTVVGQTLLQSAIPEETRGRVFAVMEFVISASLPISIVAGSALLEVWRSEAVIGCAGAIVGLGVLISTFPALSSGREETDGYSG